MMFILVGDSVPSVRCDPAQRDRMLQTGLRKLRLLVVSRCRVCSQHYCSLQTMGM